MENTYGPFDRKGGKCYTKRKEKRSSKRAHASSGVAKTATHLSRSIESATDDKTRYDTVAKQILGDKEILARILKGAVAEFRDLEIRDIVGCIEQDPSIGKIAVAPGCVYGLNTENSVPNEGKVTFDVFFYAMAPKGDERIKIFLNVEAQSKYNPGYPLEARAVFYAARMLSLQFDREFDSHHYDRLRKVYSIWICFDAPDKVKNTITEYRLQPNNIFGCRGESGRYDYLSAIIVGLDENATEVPENQLLDLLTALFSLGRSAEEREAVLEARHGIARNSERKGMIANMCNLSDNIFEKGELRGLKKGELRGLKKGELRGLKKGEQIGLENSYREALKMGLPVEQAKKIAKGISSENAAKVEAEVGIYPNS